MEVTLCLLEAVERGNRVCRLGLRRPPRGAAPAPSLPAAPRGRGGGEARCCGHPPFSTAWLRTRVLGGADGAVAAEEGRGLTLSVRGGLTPPLRFSGLVRVAARSRCSAGVGRRLSSLPGSRQLRPGHSLSHRLFRPWPDSLLASCVTRHGDPGWNGPDAASSHREEGGSRAGHA